MEFSDFNIEIRAMEDNRFEVKAGSGSSGERRATFTLSQSVDDLIKMSRWSGHGVRGSDLRAFGSAAEMTMEQPTAIGEKLFEMLFSSAHIYAAFEQCVTDAKKTDKGVRLKLTMNTSDRRVADLARLPWELLHDKSKYEYFGRYPDFSISRYLEAPQPFEVQVCRTRLRILVVSSNPRKDLALDKELDNLKKALGGNPNIDIDFLEDATVQKINAKLAQGKETGQNFHVLHYMGHGDFQDGQGALLLHDEDGGEAYVKATTFKVALLASSIRLVFLNACKTAESGGQDGSHPFAGVATALVFGGVPAVVAMQRPVRDEAAIALSEAFYSNIARGLPVDAALSAGRRAMFFDDDTTLDWAIPVLFMRSDDGVLFDFAEAPQTPAAPTPGQTHTAGGGAILTPKLDPQPVSIPVSWPAWKKWAAAAGAISLLAVLAFVLIQKAFGPAAPQRVTLRSFPDSVVMGEEFQAKFELWDKRGVAIKGEALRSYDVEWTVSAPGIVKIMKIDPTPKSEALTATILGVQAPADKSNVVVTASLKDFKLKDERPVNVKLSEKAKDDFKDAYREARAAFDNPTIEDRDVATKYRELWSKMGWIVGYVDELSALRDDEKRGAKSLDPTVKKLEEAVMAFTEASKSAAGDIALPEKEKIWKDYKSAWEKEERKASPALKHVQTVLNEIKTAKEKSAWISKLVACRGGSSRCSRPEEVFRKDDQVRIDVEWMTPPAMPGRDNLVFEWGPVGADGKFAKADTKSTGSERGRPEARNWWTLFTATSPGAYEIRARNGRGDLVWRQKVTVQ